MRVLVDARVHPGGMGGVEQVARGLARGLAALGPSDEVTFLTTADDGWLREVVGPNQVLHARRAARSLPAAVDAVRRRVLSRAPALQRLPWTGTPVPRESVLVPGRPPDVVHFVTQQGFSTGSPSLYCPHDLLHLHHPAFFAAAEVARRERVYRTLCRQASLVMAGTAWVRDDLVDRYGLARDRVRVVPWGASLTTSGETAPADVRSRYPLPARFALYPAHTWPHKNHLRLLEALAVLRDHHGVTVPVVCTGQEDRHAGTIREACERLRLGDQVRFLGRIPAPDLRALYRVAHCLVFPSLFEGWGLPVFEAFAGGVPVACSSATGLSEQTGGAALLFDPFDVGAMAEALGRVWEDASLRRQLAAAGCRRARSLTWRRTATAYRALYREVAGRPLDELDRALVDATRDGSVERVPLPSAHADQPARA